MFNAYFFSIGKKKLADKKKCKGIKVDAFAYFKDSSSRVCEIECRNISSLYSYDGDKRCLCEIESSSGGCIHGQETDAALNLYRTRIGQIFFAFLYQCRIFLCQKIFQCYSFQTYLQAIADSTASFMIEHITSSMLSQT